MAFSHRLVSCVLLASAVVAQTELTENEGQTLVTGVIIGAIIFATLLVSSYLYGVVGLITANNWPVVQICCWAPDAYDCCGIGLRTSNAVLLVVQSIVFVLSMLTFFWPGIFLCAVGGILNLLAAIMLHKAYSRFGPPRKGSGIQPPQFPPAQLPPAPVAVVVADAFPSNVYHPQDLYPGNPTYNPTYTHPTYSHPLQSTSTVHQASSSAEPVVGVPYRPEAHRVPASKI